MNPLDVRKQLHVFAEKMGAHQQLNQEEYQYLANVFMRIANGEDANAVLGVKFHRGNSFADAKLRQGLSFIIHWIECAIQPEDADIPGLGYSVSKACVEAAPILRKMMGVEDSDKYDAEYIRKCYYKPDFAHMRSEFRGILDQDSPFEP